MEYRQLGQKQHCHINCKDTCWGFKCYCNKRRSRWRRYPWPWWVKQHGNDTVDVSPLANLEITKVASNNTADFNDTISWTITVFNHGPDTALDVVLKDILPEGLVYVSDDSEGLYDPDTGLCYIGDLKHELRNTESIRIEFFELFI